MPIIVEAVDEDEKIKKVFKKIKEILGKNGLAIIISCEK
ncbi:DUF190 domain-containing protein [Methanocaldococcus infernus]